MSAPSRQTRVAAPAGGAPPASSRGRRRPSARATSPRGTRSCGTPRSPILLVAVAAMMLYLTRGLTFNLDEWIVVTERRGDGAPSLLAPHNEHLSVLIIAVFVALLKIGGLDAFPLMMVPLVALQLALGVLLFVIARARVGAGVAVGVVAFALLLGARLRELPDPGPGRADGLDRRRGGGVPRPRPPAERAQRPPAVRPHDRRAVRLGHGDPDPRRRRRRAAADGGGPPSPVGRRRAVRALRRVVRRVRQQPRRIRRARDQRPVGVDRDEPRRRRAHRRAPDRAGARRADPAAHRHRLPRVPRAGGVARAPRRDRDRAADVLRPDGDLAPRRRAAVLVALPHGRPRLPAAHARRGGARLEDPRVGAVRRDRARAGGVLEGLEARLQGGPRRCSSSAPSACARRSARSSCWAASASTRSSRSCRWRRRSSRRAAGSRRSTTCAATPATARPSSPVPRPTRASTPTTRSSARAAWRSARRARRAPCPRAWASGEGEVPAAGVRVQARPGRR